MPKPKKKKQQNIKVKRNEEIRAPEVRVIDEEGENLGVLKKEEALKKAQEKELDLILISEKADPPVARIMEYGKFMYQQEKKERQAKKNQQGDVIKGVRISMRTSEHDAKIKAKQVDKFLEKGYKVKIELFMRGREKALQKRANDNIEEFLNLLESEYVIEQEPKSYPRGLQLTIRKG